MLWLETRSELAGEREESAKGGQGVNKYRGRLWIPTGRWIPFNPVPLTLPPFATLFIGLVLLLFSISSVKKERSKAINKLMLYRSGSILIQ